MLVDGLTSRPGGDEVRRHEARRHEADPDPALDAHGFRHVKGPR